MEVSGNGMVAAYIHNGAKVGVLVEVASGKEATVGNDDFKQLVRDITLQIAAGSPFVVSREQVPAALLAKEKEIAAEQVKNKPPQAIAKIVEGKLEKFYQGYCLVDQGFVKKNSKSRSRSTSPPWVNNWKTKSAFGGSCGSGRRGYYRVVSQVLF
jgi:elongation factor Ts